MSPPTNWVATYRKKGEKTMTNNTNTTTAFDTAAIINRLSTGPLHVRGIRGYHAVDGTPLKFLALKRNGALTEVVDPGIRAFYGMELETDTNRCSMDRDEIARYVRDIMAGKGLRDVERDGSVSGFEIITEPCTLQAACYGLPWDELCATLDHLNVKAHDGENTGIHVHVSRAALGMTDDARDMVCAKILVLMDKFETQLVKFARRDWVHEYYCRKYASYDATGENSTKKMLKKFKETAKREGQNGERYRCLNLTNSHTVEFRIFKSTLNPLSIRAIFQLCDTMVTYCKTHTTPEVQSCTWSELIGTCKLPELATYCTNRGIA